MDRRGLLLATRAQITSVIVRSFLDVQAVPRTEPLSGFPLSWGIKGRSWAALQSGRLRQTRCASDWATLPSSAMSGQTVLICGGRQVVKMCSGFSPLPEHVGFIFSLLVRRFFLVGVSLSDSLSYLADFFR